MSRIALSVGLLTLIYLMTLGSLEPWDLVLGVIIASALLVMFQPVTIGRHPAPLPDLPARLAAFVPFAVQVAVDVFRGTWDVVLVMVHLRPLNQPGVVHVPIDGRSHRGIAVTALVTTISPGSYFLGVDWERDQMLFHFLDASDPDAIRDHLRQFYRRYQRRVFP